MFANGSSIAFLYAMETEGILFEKENGPALRSFQLGQTSVKEYQVAGHRVFALQMGAGTTITTRNITALLTSQRIEYLVSVGPVGSISEHGIGKWFQVETVMPWQSGSWTTGGFQPKEGWSLKTKELPAPLDLPFLSVASGDAFIAASEIRNEIAVRTSCDAVDMNLLGLMTSLDSLEVNHVHFRVISDHADDEAAEAFKVFRKNYQGKGATLAKLWIEQLPEDQTSPENYENLRKILRGTSASTQPSLPTSEESGVPED